MSQIFKSFADTNILNKTTWWLILQCGHWYHWTGDIEPKVDSDIPCPYCKKITIKTK